MIVKASLVRLPVASLLAVVVLLVALAGCNAATPSPAPVATVPAATVAATEPPTATAIPPTNTAEPTQAPTNTPIPPTNTPAPTNTPVPPTNTPEPTQAPTNTPVPPTSTTAPTDTRVPSTDTPAPAGTAASAATAAPTAQPAHKATAGLGGTLLYSIYNKEGDRWELWQYTFANGQATFLKEWRTEVAFAPDFKQVVYYGWPPAMGDKPGLYGGNADLSNEHLIILGGAYPSFSPGGDRLVAQGGEKMYILNTDGKGLHPIDIGEYPAWSPIDNWIAHRGCYGADCGLWLTHADSSERRRLTTGGGDGQPAWSPDGQQIAYISKEDGNFEIYRVNRDATNIVRLTNDAHSDGLPIWSPDGQWIAFRSDRAGAWAIYVMRPDGSEVSKVVDANVLPLWFFEKMAWRP